jgi:2-amino-4-hydroxy-6-hydroxymethyldihydropteridine diphosphokinase
MTGTVLIAFGANLGDPIRTLQVAYQELAQLWTPVAASRVYRSTPVGGVEQADFLNALAAFATQNSGSEILNTLHQVENSHARTREVRWGPRTLDLDALWEDAEPVISTDSVLTLPHPRAWERVFVTVPWQELNLSGQLAELPGYGPVSELRSTNEEITRLEIGLNS